MESVDGGGGALRCAGEACQPRRHPGSPGGVNPGSDRSCKAPTRQQQHAGQENNPLCGPAQRAVRLGANRGRVRYQSWL